MTSPTTVDEYISAFPEHTQKLLHQMRSLVTGIRPDAEERIGYGMPAYRVNGRVCVYFAAHKNHVAMYPAPRGVPGFEELDGYKGGKGTVQFPLDTPLPTALIEAIVRFRAQEAER